MNLTENTSRLQTAEQTRETLSVLMPADYPFAGAEVSSLPSVYLKRLLHDGVADQSVRWAINEVLAERECRQRWGGRRVAPIFRIPITHTGDRMSEI